MEEMHGYVGRRAELPVPLPKSPHVHLPGNPPEAVSGACNDLEQGVCLRLGGDTKKRLVTEPGPPAQEAQTRCTPCGHRKETQTCCLCSLFFFNLLFLAAPGSMWDLSFPAGD